MSPGGLPANHTPIIIERSAAGAIGDQRQSDRGEREFADRDEDEIADEPQCAGLAGRVARGGHHDKVGGATHRQPNAIFERGGLARRRACRRHSWIRIGVSTKIISGLSARNQGVGISPFQPRSTVRSVKSSAHSTIVLPCWSDVAQKKVTSAKTPSSPSTLRRSCGSSGSSCVAGAWQLVGRERAQPEQIDAEADQHADAGRREAVVPAERTANVPQTSGARNAPMLMPT